MDLPINIAVGASANSTAWKNEKWTWYNLVKRLSTPTRTPETYKQYMAANTSDQATIKDVGGFVGGYVRGGRRSKANIISRSLICLDLDFASADFWQTWGPLFPFTCVLHSTHKHGPGFPRYRLIIPLDRECTPDEYQAVSRKIAEIIDIEVCDKSTFDVNRLMYWPSVSIDSEYEFYGKDGLPASVDQFLSMYVDWRDMTEWAFHKEVRELRHAGERQQDPTAKEGIVGLFCRTYTIQDAISTFISDKYDGDGQRYTYKLGSTVGGAVVYDDKFLYSHHGTDPAQGQLCNAFDLVRIHKFGVMDEGSKASGKNAKSFSEMIRFAKDLPEVKKSLAKETFGLALKEFAPPAPKSVSFNGQSVTNTTKDPLTEAYDNARLEVQAEMTKYMGVFARYCTPTQVQLYDMVVPLAQVAAPIQQTPAPPPVAEEPTDPDWGSQMEIDPKGKYINSARNILLIMENDPFIKGCFAYNKFENRRYLYRSAPWRNIKKPEQIKDVDYAGIRSYIERAYGIASVAKIDDALHLMFDKNSFNPLTDYLDTLVWDGVPRIDTLLTRCFGAKDNIYTREALRKSLVAAVARAYVPGTKFDMVLTLVGPEGTKKSTFIRKLGKSWFSDSFNSVSGNGSFEQLQGSWLIEMGELAGLNKAEVNLIKHYVTKEYDSFRPAYGRSVETFYRQCVFFATTNEFAFLKSTTGNRRWNPIDVNVNSITLDVFSEEFDCMIDQIWAEARVYYISGEQLIFSKEAKAIADGVQDIHTDKDDRIGMIESFIHEPITDDWYDQEIDAHVMYYRTKAIRGSCKRLYVSPMEIWVECFQKDKAAYNIREGREINSMLRQIAGVIPAETAKKLGKYGKQRYYYIQ